MSDYSDFLLPENFPVILCEVFFVQKVAFVAEKKS